MTKKNKKATKTKNKKKNSTKKNKKIEFNKFYFIAKIISLIVIVILFSLLFINITKSYLIPIKYLIILLALLLVIAIVLLLMMLVKNKITNIISFILIIIFSIVSIYGINYVNSLVNNLEKIVNKEYDAIRYYLVTLKESNYNDLLSLKNKKIGLLSENLDLIQKKILAISDVAFEVSESIGTLYTSLNDSSIQAMVISKDVYKLIEEEYENFEEKTIIIYEFEIENTEENTKYSLDVDKPFIIYLSGLDTDGAVMKFWRSDVNILIVVNPKTNKILLVNTPRDYYVNLHGINGEKDKLTHAGLYGLNMSVTTIEDLYGLEINASIKVCYEALEKIVDYIGGIDVYSDRTIKKSYTVYKGMNHLNGKTALAFARERKVYETGDRHRGENQQAVITAIIDKISSNNKYLVNYAQFLNDISSYFYTNIEMKDIQKIIKNQLETMNKWQIESISVDGDGAQEYTYSLPNIKKYVMIPDNESIKIAKNKIKEFMEE